MLLHSISLLSREQFLKYKNTIPKICESWWLKTLIPSSPVECEVEVVASDDVFSTMSWNGNQIGVRPCGVFIPNSSDPAFWRKPETLIGTKIQYGQDTWTVLDAINGELFALCDIVIENHYYDLETNIWDKSELKERLETKILGLIEYLEGSTD